MKTLMRNGRDRRSENPLCATRAKSACSCLGPISGSHQGPRPQRLHSEAGYMAAPERFAQTSNFPLAPRAPSIHGTTRPLYRSLESTAIHGKRTPERSRTIAIGPAGGDLAERILLRGWPRSLRARVRHWPRADGAAAFRRGPKALAVGREAPEAGCRRRPK